MHDRMISGEDSADYVNRASACGDQELCAMAATMPALIGYWDKDLVNRFANRAYERWFGCEAEALSGARMQEAFGSALFELNRPYLDHVLHGKPAVFEWDLPAHSGRAPERVLANYLPDLAEGKVRGFFVLAHDITDLARARYRAVHDESNQVQARSSQR